MKKNLKKNLVKKSILPAAFAVMGSAIALTSVSYAWFTVGKTGSVDQIDLTVDSATGLDISTEGSNWHSIISLSELKAGGEGSLAVLPSKLTPTSTSCVINEEKQLQHSTLPTPKGAFSFFNDNKSEDGTRSGVKIDSTLTSGTPASASFMCFDLYFRVAQKDKLYLDAGSSLSNELEAHRIELASRVAFVNLGYAGEDTELARTLVGEKVKSEDPSVNAYTPGSADNIKVWEPFATEHTAIAENNYKKLYGNAIGEAKDNNFRAYKDEFKSKSDIEIKEDAGTFTAPVTTFSPSHTGTSKLTETKVPLFDLQPGITKVRIYAWVEGQDIDCNNDISGATINTILKFTLN